MGNFPSSIFLRHTETARRQIAIRQQFIRLALFCSVPLVRDPLPQYSASASVSQNLLRRFTSLYNKSSLKHKQFRLNSVVLEVRPLQLLHRFQLIILDSFLRNIVNAPLYVSNATLHTDLGIQYVQDVIQKKCIKHHTALEVHNNPLLKTVLARKEHRRLKRTWPIDLT
jgi:hypothetical protein